ncbi:MAG: hypothetical protein H7256_06685 [Bdellovibrio sp.]|nr:hypothetical protein [Bdellovibrio sp.]
MTKSEKIKHFIKDVGLPLNQAPEALGMTASDFMAWWSGFNPKAMRTQQVIQLGQFFNIHEDDILSGTYDKEFVRSVLFLGVEAVPERYSQYQFSFLRSSAHIIKFLTLTRGQHFSDMIMRKMNVSPLIYSSFDNKISLNYFVDLLEILASNGLKQDELDNLACVLFLTLSRTALGQKFKAAKTYFDCYSVLAENVHLFDTNFNYKFDLDRSQVRIETSLVYENHPHLNWSLARMDRLMRYRQIMMGWFPFLSKLPPIYPENVLKHTVTGVEASYVIKFTDYVPSQLFSLPTARFSQS